MRSVADIFSSYEVRDAEGRHVNGTDKHGANHSYGDAYEQILSTNYSLRTYREPDKNQHRTNIELMMEVGVADGSSLLAWREIFPNAVCVGMDIHHSDKAHGDRIEFYLGDQRSRKDCEAAARGRLFDFIVEDATHHLENVLLTLYYLWPFVRPGGLYIVEEWEGVSGDRDRIKALFPFAEIVGTCGPHIQDEPLVVLRKPL